MEQSTWVPDAEVNECPVCSRKFTVSFRRHHCRACKNVVCGDCSAHQLQITSGGKKERVCNPCFDRKQTEQTLKLDIKEKDSQVSWFRSFLAGISAGAVGAGISGSGSSVGSAATDLDPELQALVGSAMQRWTGVIGQLRQAEKETALAQGACEELSCEVRGYQAESQAVMKGISDMEARLVLARTKWRPNGGQADIGERGPSAAEAKWGPNEVEAVLAQIELEKAALSRTTQELQEELTGLSERMHRLEALRPKLRTGSFVGAAPTKFIASK